MSILIKGMEMPKTGEYRCVIRKWQQGGTLTIDLYGEEELSGTIVPIPPHGRLIDADYADEYAYDELELANNYLTGWEAARAMQKIYQAAPTVIPADKDGGT